MCISTIKWRFPDQRPPSNLTFLCNCENPCIENALFHDEKNVFSSIVKCVSLLSSNAFPPENLFLISLPLSTVFSRMMKPVLKFWKANACMQKRFNGYGNTCISTIKWRFLFFSLCLLTVILPYRGTVDSKRKKYVQPGLGVSSNCHCRVSWNRLFHDEKCMFSQDLKCHGRI